MNFVIIFNKFGLLWFSRWSCFWTSVFLCDIKVCSKWRSPGNLLDLGFIRLGGRESHAFLWPLGNWEHLQCSRLRKLLLSPTLLRYRQKSNPKALWRKYALLAKPLSSIRLLFKYLHVTATSKKTHLTRTLHLHRFF